MDTMKAAVYAACVLEGKEVGEDEVAVSVRRDARLNFGHSHHSRTAAAAATAALDMGRCPSGGRIASRRPRRCSKRYGVLC